MESIIATDNASLASLAARLHHQWFAADAMQWDQASNTLTLPFSDAWDVSRGWRVAPREELFQDRLLLRDVLGYSVHDEARIALYDLADIRFDRKEAIVTIESGFPFELVASVSSLNIEYQCR